MIVIAATNTKSVCKLSTPTTFWNNISWLLVLFRFGSWIYSIEVGHTVWTLPRELCLHSVFSCERRIPCRTRWSQPQATFSCMIYWTITSFFVMSDLSLISHELVYKQCNVDLKLSPCRMELQWFNLITHNSSMLSLWWYPPALVQATTPPSVLMLDDSPDTKVMEFRKPDAAAELSWTDVQTGSSPEPDTKNNRKGKDPRISQNGTQDDTDRFSNWEVRSSTRGVGE